MLKVVRSTAEGAVSLCGSNATTEPASWLFAVTCSRANPPAALKQCSRRERWAAADAARERPSPATVARTSRRKRTHGARSAWRRYCQPTGLKVPRKSLGNMSLGNPGRLEPGRERSENEMNKGIEGAPGRNRT